MINKPPVFPGLSMRMPTVMTIQGKGVVDSGSTYGVARSSLGYFKSGGLYKGIPLDTISNYSDRDITPQFSGRLLVVHVPEGLRHPLEVRRGRLSR